MAIRDSQDRPVIVVGYDGSPTARAAVDWAARRAGADGLVYVVYAYGPPGDWRGFPDYGRILLDHQDRGRSVLDALATDGPLLGTTVETELLEGPAALAILKVADTRRADEIVVGSRGHGLLRSAALGSVSSDLVQRSHIPVVVIPEAGSRENTERMRQVVENAYAGAELVR